VISENQVYVACNPLDEGRRIRIVSYRPGAQRAHVVDAVTGKRYRQITTASLHQSATTRDGAARRTGYVLAAD
jgi:hypothetical protein